MNTQLLINIDGSHATVYRIDSSEYPIKVEGQVENPEPGLVYDGQITESILDLVDCLCSTGRYRNPF